MQIKRMIQLYEQGSTQAEIAEQAGLSQTGVGKILRQNGIQTRRSGQRERPREDRFWEHVDKRGPVHPKLHTRCWLWTASTRDFGHGQFSQGPGKSPIRAHRYSWILKYGKIPKGKCVLHKCDVPACVRPTHLFLGPRAENQEDMRRKGRAARGERVAGAVLNARQVRKIRTALAKGESRTEVAHRFGVAYHTISDIELGRTWSHVAPRVPGGM